jgi:hypothetical protein
MTEEQIAEILSLIPFVKFLCAFAIVHMIFGVHDVRIKK